MNEIVKKIIAEKLKEALQKESLTKLSATKLLNIKHCNYLVAMCSGNWKDVTDETWKLIQCWINSGETIRKYSEKLNKKPDIEPEEESLSIEEESKENEPEKSTHENQLAEVPLLGAERMKDLLHKIGIQIDITLTINGKKVKL